MQRVGRYVLHEEFASGGMAAVHLGQMLGDRGFARVVAIKRLHAHYANTADAMAMFIDEARLSARVRHRNIVATLDVAEHEGQLYLVMEYVDGVPLSLLVKLAEQRGEPVPVDVACSIVLDALAGLEAVHQAKDERGHALAIVHRDVSPQNVLVGADGSARVLDFGIAKAAVRLQTTKTDQLKGKLRYMSPEQVMDREVDGRTDEFAAGIVLWELLTGQKLFKASNEAATIAKILEGVIVAPSKHRESVSPALDAVVLRALERDVEKRFASCKEMADALRSAIEPAPADRVACFVREHAAQILDARAKRVESIEANEALPAAEPAPAAAGVETETRPLPEATPRSSPPRVRVLVTSAALACALIAMAFWSRSGADAPALPIAATEPVASASSPGPAPADSLGALATATLAPAAVASPPSAAPVASGRPHVRRPVLRPRGDRPGVGAAPTRPGCAEMTMVDENGIRRMKPECL